MPVLDGIQVGSGASSTHRACTNDEEWPTLTNRDANGLRRSAHTLKSTAATVGALPLAEVCKDIERLAREGKLDEVAPLLNMLAQLDGESRTAAVALQPQFAAAALAENR